MSYILGIDIGTGSTKAVVVTDLYKPGPVTQQYYATQSSQVGYSEQNPEEIWNAFKTCIREILTRRGSLPDAVSLSSAMHSLIPVDASGEALAPMITWSDSRSAEIAKTVQQSDVGMAIYRATGTPIHAMSPLCKIIWIKENRPELFEKTYKFISIKEFIWFKLFGEYKIDHSIASCTGLFDIRKFEWDSEALNLAGIKPEQLSDPVQTHYSNSISNFHALDLKGESLLFFIGASDGCLANLGTKAIGDGLAAVTIGTSGAIRISSKKPIVNNQAMTFSYILDQETYICGGPVNNGGIALQWLLKNLFGKNELKSGDYNALFEMVEEVPAASNGLLFLPYLSGERAPIWDSESCGTFFGLNLKHDQKTLARAVIEGICYALNDVLKTVQESSEEIRQIHVSGGFVHSKIWMQILADITGKKIILIQEEDASAVGAAYLAFKTLKNLDQYPELPNEEPEVIDFNVENHRRYQRNFQIFKQLYVNLKTTMHQLYYLNN